MPVPKGLQKGMDRLGIETPVMGDAPPAATPPAAVAPPVSPATPEPAAVVEPIAPVVAIPEIIAPVADGNGMVLTYDDDDVPSAPPQSEAARALRIAEDALAMRTQAHEELQRRFDTLEAELAKRPDAKAKGVELPDFVVERLDTEAVPAEAFDAILGVLRPAITSYVQVAVERAVESVLGQVDTRVSASADQLSRNNFYATIAASIKDKFDVDFSRVQNSHQFKAFLESRVPGTTSKVGNVLSSAWRLQDAEVIMTHMQRFVESARGAPASTTVTAAAGAAPGPQVGRGGAAAPTRYSRAAMHGQMAEARKKRDHVKLGELNAQLDAAEKAGLLTD